MATKFINDSLEDNKDEHMNRYNLGTATSYLNKDKNGEITFNNTGHIGGKGWVHNYPNYYLKKQVEKDATQLAKLQQRVDLLNKK